MWLNLNDPGPSVELDENSNGVSLIASVSKHKAGGEGGDEEVRLRKMKAVGLMGILVHSKGYLTEKCNGLFRPPRPPAYL
ncbi:hypothetical protein L2E82_02186 [Cichorium intybus]|uniref:Uncharacterized protein n=1 Tax=Cichorium intybus TaxID=13427 RepID=A0ACB9H234_CICIN|nr:hypothetical protein L2E82_02186 [Cichorium intybus]